MSPQDFHGQLEKLICDGLSAQARELLRRRVLSGAPFHEYPYLAEKLAVLAQNATPIRMGALSTFTIEAIRGRLAALLPSADVTGCNEAKSTKYLDLNARRGKHGVIQALLPPTGRLTR